MKFSIIIPVKEINDCLKESVPAMLGMDYDDYEIIILPNDMPDRIPGCLEDRKIRIIATGKVSPAVKRDIGAEESRGGCLAFIDDDAFPEHGWLRVAEQLFNEKRASAICGPAITPKTDSMSQKASGLIFETLLGGGGMAFRYRPAKRSFYVDDCPTVNLIVSREAFFDVNGFDSSFWPGEDTKFCLDLTRKGHRIWYSNKLIVWHHRRKLFLPHLRQVGSYGRHRGYFAKRFPQTSFRLTYFMPMLFLLGNIGLLGLSFFDIMFFQVWLALIGLYSALLFLDVFTRTSKLPVGLLAVTAIFLTHLTYGVMFARGLCSGKPGSGLR